MFGLNPYVIGGALVAVSLALGGAYLKGRSDVAQAQAVATAKAKVEAAKELRENQAQLRNATDVELCIELSGDREACAAAGY